MGDIARSIPMHSQCQREQNFAPLVKLTLHGRNSLRDKQIRLQRSILV